MGGVGGFPACRGWVKTYLGAVSLWFRAHGHIETDADQVFESKKVRHSTDFFIGTEFESSFFFNAQCWFLAFDWTGGGLPGSNPRAVRGSGVEQAAASCCKWSRFAGKVLAPWFGRNDLYQSGTGPAEFLARTGDTFAHAQDMLARRQHGVAMTFTTSSWAKKH